ncbi:MAG: DUF2791 family P-loop domain-containing protein [Armatimonadetes bacterium]|nr:DUF2791 family P-loop domain-containing protein [Armatimonadota bacterium]
MSVAIKPRERDAILSSLRAGVVPRIGLRHIQVGRRDEVAAVLNDLERVGQGGASVRFIIGRYGAGKSFFLYLMRAEALERKFVVAQADITLERRLHGSGGQGRALYAELMRNVAVRAKPDGGALASIVERWVSDVDHQVRQGGGADAHVASAIHERLKGLQELVSSYDFSTVIQRYFEGFQKGNDTLQDHALRWLRGEYTTRTEARQDLGVRTIIDDTNVYDYLKLFAAFVRLSGYAGLLVNVDEMGVLSHRLSHAQARMANYEVLLSIVNDCLQGNVGGIGFLFGGTDAFLDDRRRGLASYEALATRLAANRFATEGLRDCSGPVLRLETLRVEELHVLLQRIRSVFAGGDPAKHLVPDEALLAFLNHCQRTLGAEFFTTPRDAAKAFVGFLSVLEQNPGTPWQQVLTGTPLERSTEPDEQVPVEGDPDAGGAGDGSSDRLAAFRL